MKDLFRISGTNSTYTHKQNSLRKRRDNHATTLATRKKVKKDRKHRTNSGKNKKIENNENKTEKTNEAKLRLSRKTERVSKRASAN